MGFLNSDSTGFKWWVTPANLLFISLFLLIIDYEVNDGSFFRMNWSYWVVLIIWTAYLVKLIITRHPRTAWLFFPSLMLIIAVYLLLIDYFNPPNNGPLGLDFAVIPASAVFIFGTLIPIISRLGYKEPTPEERFAKIEPLVEEKNNE